MMKEGKCAFVMSPVVSLTEYLVEASTKKNLPETIFDAMQIEGQARRKKTLSWMHTFLCTLLMLKLMPVLISVLSHASSLSE